MVRIAVIIGSTRPNRFGPKAAHWMMEQTKKFEGNAEFELVDVADFNLPLLDEPNLPAFANYTKDYTKKWSEKIDSFDGFIFVTAEYNHSIPAALKNAIDYLWKEWNYKPVSFVSYGAAAGGVRAVEDLRGLSAQMHMFDLREQVIIHEYYTLLDDQGNFQAKESHEKEAQKLLGEVTFWAEKMKPIRAELQAQ